MLRIFTFFLVNTASIAFSYAAGEAEEENLDGFTYRRQAAIVNVSEIRIAFYDVCPLANFTNLPSTTTFSNVMVTKNDTKPFRLKASLNLALIRFIEIDDLKQVMSLFVSAMVEWRLPCDVEKFCDTLVERQALDKGSVRNATKTFAIFKFRRPISEVWSPSFTLVNAASKPHEMMQSITGEKVMIYPFTPSSLWISNFRMDTSCDGFSFKKFPFDGLACNVTFEALDPLELVGYTFDRLFIPGGYETFVNPTDVWRLVTSPDDLRSYVSGKKYAEDETLAVLTFELKFKRKYQYYISTVILPVYGLFLLQLGILILPPKLTDRPAFAMAVVLAFAFLLSIVYDKLPATSEDVYLSISVSIKFYWGVAVTLYCLLGSAMDKTIKQYRVKWAWICSTISLSRFLDVIVTAVELSFVAASDAVLFALMLSK